MRRGAHGVWVVRPAAAGAEFADVERAVHELMERARLFRPESSAPGRSSPAESSGREATASAQEGAEP
jgi:hypothetical protein